MSYHDFGCEHASCNAHHLRELVAAGEAYPEHTWPRIARNTLEELNTAAHTAREAGLDAIPAPIVDPLIARFVRTVHLSLLVRLRDCQHHVLLFARDLTVWSPTSKPNATCA